MQTLFYNRHCPLSSEKFRYLLPLWPFLQLSGVRPLHGLLLDLRYGEFRLLVVREVRGDNEAAEEVDEVKDITVECALLPTDVDKRGDDELGTIDVQVIGKDVI